MRMVQMSTVIRTVLFWGLLAICALGFTVPTTRKNGLVHSSANRLKVEPSNFPRSRDHGPFILYSTAEDKVKTSSHVIGDTAGAVIVVENGIVSAGDTDLIKDVNWRIMPNERVALVGTNGAGKSTLLRSVVGEHFLADGKITLKQGVTLGHLRQTSVSGSTKTVFEEASSEMTALNDAERKLEELEALCMEDPSDKNFEKLGKANDLFVALGGNNKAQTVGRVLEGLGFKAADHGRSCADFSGGWQMRIGLARLLLSRPTALLLDEPTNHLDKAAKDWLAGYLARYEGAVVVITHDEDLLRGLRCDAVAEVRGGRLHYFRSDYAAFLRLREERVEQAQRAYEAQQREIEKLQGFVDRFGAKASKASSAQSRVKQLERMDKLEAPTAIERQTRRPKFALPAPPAGAVEPLGLTGGAAFGWGERPLLQGVDFMLERGSKYVVLGPNGVGKSTLLKALSGKVPLLRGARTEGQGLRLGVFTQDLAQDLPVGEAALDHVLQVNQNTRFVDGIINIVVRQSNPAITNLEARNTMGALGLTGNMPLRKIGMLSGGEKARVALAIFCLVPYNVLLLDEPSNHLDVDTVEVLVEALAAWEGTVLVISHNEEFCRRLNPTHVGIVGGGRLKMEERALKDSDWKFTVPSSTASAISTEEEESKVAAPAAAVVKEEVTNPAAPKKMLDKETRKQLNNKRNRVKKIENLLGSHEQKLEKLEDEMLNIGGDTGLMDLYKQKEKIQEEDAVLMEEWETLEVEIAAIEEEYEL